MTDYVKLAKAMLVDFWEGIEGVNEQPVNAWQASSTLKYTYSEEELEHAYNFACILRHQGYAAELVELKKPNHYGIRVGHYGGRRQPWIIGVDQRTGAYTIPADTIKPPKGGYLTVTMRDLSKLKDII